MHSEVRHFGTVRCGIHFWLMWYKNYWNQSRFAKVVAKSLQPYFYGWQCMSVSMACIYQVQSRCGIHDRRMILSLWWSQLMGMIAATAGLSLSASTHYLCVGPSVWLPVCLLVCLSVWLSVCLPAWLSVCFYYHVHISREARFKRCIFMSNLKVVSAETSCSVVLIILFPMQHFINIC